MHETLLISALILLAACGDEALPPGIDVVAQGDAEVASIGLDVATLATAFPPCEYLEPSERLDLDTACADGICRGMTLEQMEAVLGSAECEPLSHGEGTRCKWSGRELSVHTHSGRSHPTSQIFVGSDYGGSTADGLGPGVSMACVLEALGAPDELEIEWYHGRYVVSEMLYKVPHVYFADDLAHRTRDGRVHRMSLRGATSP